MSARPRESADVTSWTRLEKLEWLIVLAAVIFAIVFGLTH